MQPIYLIYGITDYPSCLIAQTILMQAEIEYVFIEMDFSKSYQETIKQEFDRSTFPIIVEVTPDGKELIGGLADCMQSKVSFALKS